MIHSTGWVRALIRLGTRNSSTHARLMAFGIQDIYASFGCLMLIRAVGIFAAVEFTPRGPSGKKYSDPRAIPTDQVFALA